MQKKAVSTFIWFNRIIKKKVIIDIIKPNIMSKPTLPLVFSIIYIHSVKICWRYTQLYNSALL